MATIGTMATIVYGIARPADNYRSAAPRRDDNDRNRAAMPLRAPEREAPLSPTRHLFFLFLSPPLLPRPAFPARRPSLSTLGHVANNEAHVRSLPRRPKRILSLTSSPSISLFLSHPSPFVLSSRTQVYTLKHARTRSKGAAFLLSSVPPPQRRT